MNLLHRENFNEIVKQCYVRTSAPPNKQDQTKSKYAICTILNVESGEKSYEIEAGIKSNKILSLGFGEDFKPTPIKNISNKPIEESELTDWCKEEKHKINIHFIILLFDEGIFVFLFSTSCFFFLCLGGTIYSFCNG